MALPKISKWRKFYSTALTFWIPIKSYRRALRAILQFGVCKYFRVIKNDRKTKFANEIAIGAIMKDEGPYLKEWLDFHILVGIKKFFLYDNDSTDNTPEILKPYIERGIVEYHFVPGSQKQLFAYNDILERHSADTRYIAFIDLDEFLVPVQNKTIPEFLHTLPQNFTCVVASWVLYGSSGHIKKPRGLVIENYKYRQPKPSGCKSIVNPRLIIAPQVHIHFVAGFVRDENGRKLGRIDQTNNPPSVNKLRCNHYITKSYEEFQERLARGGPSNGPNSEHIRRKAQKFDKLNDGAIYDDIMDKYVEPMKKFKL